MKKINTEIKNIEIRPPVVVIMGHVDHGKSTLLDYIRNTNVVESEAGGITQRISAYEVIHKDENGINKKITFIDTPGHEAFSKMRERGANIADIAILIVSAEDGVKNQTIEAWKTIEKCKIPTIVAINKIDKGGANIEKTKKELGENEIYIEGYGGTIPCVEISAKTGKGIEELLSLINIVSEMEELKGNNNTNATGFVLETNLDQKRGIESVLLIKDGFIKKGMWIVSGESISPVRILEDFKGKMIENATFSSPVRLVGFDKMPRIGSSFCSFYNKDEAIKYKEENKALFSTNQNQNEIFSDKKMIPIIIKADTSGSIEAIEKEIEKIECENAIYKIIQKGEGTIGEKDIKSAMGNENGIVLGFNVKIDNNANFLAERNNITILTFDIIYKMTEWLKDEIEKRRPKIETMEITGKAKILKTFSKTKEKQILGGKVIEGNILLGNVKILRREFEIGTGKITNLEKGKTKTDKVEEGTEFGIMIESKIEIVAGDLIENFCIIKK